MLSWYNYVQYLSKEQPIARAWCVRASYAKSRNLNFHAFTGSRQPYSSAYRECLRRIFRHQHVLCIKLACFDHTDCRIERRTFHSCKTKFFPRVGALLHVALLEVRRDIRCEAVDEKSTIDFAAAALTEHDCSQMKNSLRGWAAGRLH